MEPVAIIGLGASTPIGRSVWASAAAVRAGVSGFFEHPSMIDTAGEAMRVAKAPWLPTTMEEIERCRELVVPAILEALTVMGTAFPAVRVGLALALPPERPGRQVRLAHELLTIVSQYFPRRFSSAEVFEHGHAAGHLAVDTAIRSLQNGHSDAYVVAGVDSYLAPETLEWIEECDQLHGGGELNNAWGFIPGEAAGALLLTTTRFSDEHQVERLGDVLTLGIDHEPNLIKTDTVCVGEGLTRALRAALTPLPRGARIDNVFCDLNGETYRADEYGFAALRTREWFRAATDFVAPADCWGDVGAAGTPLHIALGVIAHRKRYGKGPLSMVCASSESGERGAAVICGYEAGGG